MGGAGGGKSVSKTTDDLVPIGRLSSARPTMMDVRRRSDIAFQPSTPVPFLSLSPKFLSGIVDDE